MEVNLRFAELHHKIMCQNQDVIIEQISKQITRLLRSGSVKHNLFIRDRYASFYEQVLPFIYYFKTINEKGEEVWVESPYPFSKFIFLIQKLDVLCASISSQGQAAKTFQIAKDLLNELFCLEKDRVVNFSGSVEVPTDIPANIERSIDLD